MCYCLLFSSLQPFSEVRERTEAVHVLCHLWLEVPEQSFISTLPLMLVFQSPSIFLSPLTSQLLPPSCSNIRYLYLFFVAYWTFCLPFTTHSLPLMFSLFLGASTKQSNPLLPLLLVSFPAPQHTKHMDQMIGSSHVLFSAQKLSEP